MSDSKPFEIRASLLHLAKDVLTQNAHMNYEASKENGTRVWKEVSSEAIIAEAEKLYKFVSNK